MNGYVLLSFANLKAKGIPFSRVHLFRLIAEGKFPKPIKISEARSAWIESEIDDWIAARAAERE